MPEMIERDNMGYIKYLNSTKIYEVKVVPSGNNLVEIEFGDSPVINTSGFCFNNKEDFSSGVLGEYSKFITIYQKKDTSVILSNDGSVYPKVSTQSEETLQEKVIKLEEKNTSLIQQLGVMQDALDFLLLS